MPLTRYEEIMLAHSSQSDDLAARFARASQLARAAIPVTSEVECELQLRDQGHDLQLP